MRLAIVEHITSKPSLLLPIKRIVERLCDRRVPVLVDGAHCPGQVHTLPTARRSPNAAAGAAAQSVGTRLLHCRYRSVGIVRAASLFRTFLPSAFWGIPQTLQ